jgi:hypothetical protein
MVAKLSAAALLLAAATAHGQLFYERATLGQTGLTSGGGLACSNLFFTGWRFEVTNGPIQVSRIGGHFFPGSGSVFGAIVQLTGPNDDPDDFALTTPDVLGTTLVPLPTGGSNEASGPISLTLQNGWYLAVCGSGAFGATGSASYVAQNAATAVPGAALNVTYRQASHPSGPLAILQGTVVRVFVEYSLGGGPACYANCDESTTPPVLNVQDFGCFLNSFAAGESYANCDGSTTPPVLNVQDFGCFLNAFAAGCT